LFQASILQNDGDDEIEVMDDMDDSQQKPHDPYFASDLEHDDINRGDGSVNALGFILLCFFFLK
jgi:hypothetical protein